MVESKASIKSADRVLDIIDFAAINAPFTFTELVDALGLPRSSAHGLVATLVKNGWLEHDETARQYRLGLRAWLVAQRYDGHRGIVQVALPIMNALRDDLGETIQLARLDGVENLYIAISESRQPMRLASSVGSRLYAHATGLGKALLAQLDPDDAQSRLASATLPSFTEHTKTTVPEIMKQVEHARLVGFAVDDEEYVTGCRCVAVPVYNDGLGLVVALSVTAPTSRFARDWIAHPKDRLLEAASQIREQLELTGKA